MKTIKHIFFLCSFSLIFIFPSIAFASNPLEKLRDTAQSEPQTIERMISEGSFYISQKIGDEWDLKYIEPYGVQYSTKEFTIDNTGDLVKVRIEQKNIPFGDIEKVSLKACGNEIVPQYAKYVLSQESVLEDILYDDNNVIVNHDNPIELSWSIPEGCVEDPILYLTANEYDSKPEDAFRFPSDEDYKTYEFVNSGSIEIDGVIDEVDGIQEPTFQPFWQPGTGHPDGYTYIYVNDDEQYVYLSLDLVIDNTKEYGLDWLKIIAVNSITRDEKEYFVNDLVDTYGKCGFGLTSKVDYKHQTCEVKIPKSEIVGDSLDFYLKYYGTASAPPEPFDATLCTGQGTTSHTCTAPYIINYIIVTFNIKFYCPDRLRVP